MEVLERPLRQQKIPSALRSCFPQDQERPRPEFLSSLYHGIWREKPGGKGAMKRKRGFYYHRMFVEHPHAIYSLVR